MAELGGHEGFMECYRNKKPVVLLGIASEWRALHLWQDPEVFERKLIALEEFERNKSDYDEVWHEQPALYEGQDAGSGEGTIVVMKARDGVSFLELPEYVEKTRVPVSELLEAAFGQQGQPGPCLYARVEIPRPLIDDVRLPFELFAPEPSQRLERDFFSPWNSRLWIGTAGNITPCHFDRAHGVLCQIRGVKRVYMFSPEDSPNLYPHSGDRSDAHAARVDVNAVFSGDLGLLEAQLARFPRLARAQPHVCDLLAGEILYIPPGWWHCVVSIESSISLTFPFGISAREHTPPSLWR